MDNKKATNPWHNHDVLLICEDNNYYNIIREILRPLKWIVHLPAADASSARERQLSKPFAAIIVVESKKINAPEVLRVLFQTDRGRLTPTIVISNFTESLDIQILQKVFNVLIVSKPLIPIKFMSAFKDMVTHWEKPALFALRHLANLPADPNNDIMKITILEKLTSDQNASPYAMQAIISIMMEQGLYREAEKKILEYFRANPHNPGILAQCAWFYLDSRAPHYALKFLNKLKQMAPTSVVFNIDLALGHLACGHLEEALRTLQEWNNYFPGNPLIESYIARLMVAEGYQEKHESFGIPKSIVKRTLEAWQSFDQSQNPVPTKNSIATKAS